MVLEVKVRLKMCTASSQHKKSDVEVRLDEIVTLKSKQFRYLDSIIEAIFMINEDIAY